MENAVADDAPSGCSVRPIIGNSLVSGSAPLKGSSPNWTGPTTGSAAAADLAAPGSSTTIKAGGIAFRISARANDSWQSGQRTVA
jgi:hypothetical protein